jgi:predicted HD superfamily hydrolase involved in NAD metabolism
VREVDLIGDVALRVRMAPELPDGLLAHIDRVVALGDELARRHGLNVAQVRLAAQGHDLLRAVGDEELLARGEARRLELDSVERAAPLMLHGPLAALELRERFEVEDEAALHAIRWHTTGHPDYSGEAWAMFVADKVEPSKVSRTPELGVIRELAGESLEAAALAYLEFRLAEAIERRWQVHPMSTLARNALLVRGGWGGVDAGRS